MAQETAARVTWLFTRNDESVFLEARSADKGVQLLVHGPGTKKAVHDFTDSGGLMMFQLDYERYLREEGFNLHAMAERRNGTERRMAGDSDRRR